jgi:hypothetical protein
VEDEEPELLPELEVLALDELPVDPVDEELLEDPPPEDVLDELLELPVELLGPPLDEELPLDEPDPDVLPPGPEPVLLEPEEGVETGVDTGSVVGLPGPGSVGVVVGGVVIELAPGPPGPPGPLGPVGTVGEVLPPLLVDSGGRVAGPPIGVTVGPVVLDPPVELEPPTGAVGVEVGPPNDPCPGLVETGSTVPGALIGELSGSDPVGGR